MPANDPEFQLKIASHPEEIAAAQRLRYEVFVEELGASGPGVDHDLAQEADRFDPYAEHLLLIDRTREANLGVVGTYRLLPGQAALATSGFYSETEFDLSPLVGSGRKLVELGRSCVLAEYRGGTAMFELWAGLGDYAVHRGIDILFGVASFHGTDPSAFAQSLSYLHHHHLAAPDLRVRAAGEGAVAFQPLPKEQLDRRAAMVALPPLLKAYLRVGGVVGQGAWIDRAFNTIDVCMILDVARMPARQRALYAKGRLAA